MAGAMLGYLDTIMNHGIISPRRSPCTYNLGACLDVEEGEGSSQERVLEHWKVADMIALGEYRHLYSHSMALQEGMLDHGLAEALS
jgi:hypothetical protein